jgi:hypothetical protein
LTQIWSSKELDLKIWKTFNTKKHSPSCPTDLPSLPFSERKRLVFEPSFRWETFQ